jgi:hypothetical protein
MKLAPSSRWALHELSRKHVNERAPSRTHHQEAGGTAFTRFTEAVEDRLRAGKVSATTIGEAMNLMNRAANVLNGALAAGRSVANDIVSATKSTGPNQTTTPSTTGQQPTTTQSASSTQTANEASSPARDTKVPGSGEEKL